MNAYNDLPFGRKTIRICLDLRREIHIKFYAISSITMFDDRLFAMADYVEHETGEAEDCEECGGAVSMREWLEPLKVKLSKPKYGDFILFPLLVSETFRAEYEKSGLQGITRFRKVEVVKVSRKRPNSPEPPNYYSIDIARSKTRLDEHRSGYVWTREPDCDVCRGGILENMTGVCIDSDTWDGLDIFYPVALSGTPIVSERFYEFVKQHRFTNVVIVPAEEYRLSYCT